MKVVGPSTASSRARTTSTAVKALVRAGWNDRSWTYRPDGASRDGASHDDAEYAGWVAPLLRELPRGARVLDLGCGCGLPVDRWLARRFHLTGVDISDVQIRRARRLVPSARFLRADMTEVDFEPGSFDAIISLYAIIHVPLVEQRPLFRRVHRWLVPGGRLVAVLGAERYRGTETGWLGHSSPMFWDHEGTATYRRWLRDAGFVVDETRFIPEGEGGHALVRAHRPRRPPPRPTIRRPVGTVRRARRDGR